VRIWNETFFFIAQAAVPGGEAHLEARYLIRQPLLICANESQIRKNWQTSLGL